MVSTKTMYSLLKGLMFITLGFFITGCSTYNKKISGYYNQVINQNYEAADKALSKSKILHKSRNLLLLYMEKGRLEHLKGNFEESNVYLNKADLLIEDQIISLKNVAAGIFLNSMSQNYKGEEYEIFLLHYYKALNYLYLGQTQEAVVEARRITLQNYALADKYKSNRYSQDAFSLNMQGLIYESAKNYNDAFIAYRNAVEVYQKAAKGSYYGVTLPENLKYDVMNMAHKLGFTSELKQFEKDFNTTFKPSAAPEGGELVVFWENGRAPIKKEERITFTLIKGESGALVFTNVLGFVVPLDFGIAGKTNLNRVHSVKIAFPNYLKQSIPYTTSQVSINEGETYLMQKVQDIDELAIATLKERTTKELSHILTRLAVKKSGEYAVKSASKSHPENARLKRAGFGLQLYNFFSEKADTRNWQTLPAQINYTRVPLNKGDNKLKVELQNPLNLQNTVKVEVEANGRMQFFNFASMK